MYIVFMTNEDMKRRRGAFYTPELFAEYAHKMIEEKFGEDWKEKYVVWDNCCGEKALTKSHKFGELYSSTIDNDELENSVEYNKEGVAFQFDFLNDSLDKLPHGLLAALRQDKPIIFFINPPYATASNIARNCGTKKGVSETMVNNLMVDKKLGACSSNLYAQFLYRIIMIKMEFNLTDVHICLFSPTLFLTGPTWKVFRAQYLKEFAFSNAVQFKASHFSDVADDWGISFSIWNSGETVDKENFNCLLIDNIDGEIKESGNKVLYNLDNRKSANDWVREDLKKCKGKKDFGTPNLSSAIKVKEGCTKSYPGSIGYMFNKANNVDSNDINVALFSAMYFDAHGISMQKNSIPKCAALFSARRLVAGNWINSKDEYLAPDENHPLYGEFVNDSIVYSMFESKSYQSSLRRIDYKGKKWDIKNEFFWMAKDEIVKLADMYQNYECYKDAIDDDDRYFHYLLQSITLSKEAQAVLDKANEIVRNTFKYREMFDQEHPEYQINNWDCGWYQIKALAKEYDKAEYDEFVTLFKALAEKMRPMVFELGFLKN